jgi:hypothetical protein
MKDLGKFPAARVEQSTGTLSADYEPGLSAVDAVAYDVEREQYAAARIVGSATTSGRPTRWSTVAPGLFDRASVESRITRNKRRTSYVAGSAIPWNRTTGDDGMVDPATDSVLRVVTGDDDERRFGMTNERALVAAADAILATSAGLDVETPTGRVTSWNDEARLGGYRLTDRPYERTAERRAMLPTFVGPHRGDRAMIDETTVDEADYCHDHETDVETCGCHRPRHNTLGACSRHVYELSGLADAFGHAVEHDGSTSVRDAHRVRSSVRAPGRSRAYDLVDVLHETETGRKVRGVSAPAVTVIYDRGTHRVDERGRSLPDVEPTATVHETGSVTALLSFVERVSTAGTLHRVTWTRLPDDERGARWSCSVTSNRGAVERVPFVGSTALDVERRDVPAGRSTRSARDAARSAVASLTERRGVVARELSAALSGLPVSRTLVDVETSAGTVSVGRSRADRYVVGSWSAGSAAALAVRASRLLVTS